MAFTEMTALLTASAAIIGAAWATISWTLNLREKRATEGYQRKEQVYREIVVGLQALYKTENAAERDRFIVQTRITWIYCPDEVVRELNVCLDALIVKPAPVSPQQEALSKAVAAMRKDLMPKTTLTYRDFRNVTA